MQMDEHGLYDQCVREILVNGRRLEGLPVACRDHRSAPAVRPEAHFAKRTMRHRDGGALLRDRLDDAEQIRTRCPLRGGQDILVQLLEVDVEMPLVLE